MGHRPLADPPLDPEKEPDGRRLELVSRDPGEPTDDPEEEEESEPQLRDPLKLYVRQIGDGRLLTPPE